MARINARHYLRILDELGGGLCGKVLVWLLPQQHTQATKSPEKILFIKLWAIGESTLTLPALCEYKKKHPNIALTVLTTSYNAPVFTGQPYIDVVIAKNLLGICTYALWHIRQFDVAIDGEPYAFLSAIIAWVLGQTTVGFATCKRDFLFSHPLPYNDTQHAMHTYANLLEVSAPSSLLPIAYTDHDANRVRHMLQRFHIQATATLVLIAPTVGGSALSRMWPTDRYVAVAQQLLTNKNTSIIYIGSKRDAKDLEEMQRKTGSRSYAVSTLTIPQAAYMASQSRLVIANDSGFMHIAAAMNSAVLGLFGPNTPIRFAPHNAKSKAIYRPCPKSPHIHVHKACIPDSPCACMQNIQVKEVLDVAHQMLSSYTQ